MRTRLLLGIAVLMMMVPTFLFFGGPLRAPLMVEGDRLEMRTCPNCHGLKQEPACRRCRGRGVIEFIIPGPNRPLRIIGHVYAPDETVVPDAGVCIVTTAGNINLRTDPTGRFGTTLPPGSYPMTLTSQGRPETHLDLKIPSLTEPAAADTEPSFREEQWPFHFADK